jgi:hypothetical protein
MGAKPRESRINKTWNTPPRHLRGKPWSRPTPQPWHGAPVRTLADMTPDEIAAIEAEYGCPVLR